MGDRQQQGHGTDGPPRPPARPETPSPVSELRLDALQQTIASVMGGGEVDAALSAILHSTAAAVQGRAHVLHVRPLPWLEHRVLTIGLDESTAESICDDLESGVLPAGALTSEIQSSGRDYGHLVAYYEGDAASSEQRALLDAYGRLAASALDARVILEQARRDTEAAQVLLDLSTALAEVATIDQAAARLARAVPRLIDCDRVVVVMFTPGTDRGRIAASYGFEATQERLLNSLSFSMPPHERDRDLAFYDVASENGLVRSLLAGTGSIAGINVPIAIEGEISGCVVATVTDQAARLRDSGRGVELLRALAAQASTAIRNTQLLGQIQHQAMHDALTNLPNRTLILDRLDRMLARARRTGIPPAALFIDLDGFKDINDTLGHGVGDHVLCAVAERLASALRGADSIGRLGGDEFVVLVEGDSENRDPELVAKRLLDVLREPFRLTERDGLPLAISASIGIASGLRTGAAELLRDADVALYRAKAKGKGCYMVFEAAMHVAVRDRMELEMDLHGAFERSELFLMYQPIFDLREHRLSGAEALLRWQHPRRGLVSPDTFVPLLEESRLIVDVGRWILEEACASAARWHAQGHHIDISVNVSARQLEEPDFADEVGEVVAHAGLDPARLVLEVTETALMRDPETTSRRLHALKQLGVQIAVDDFGTGYSSLTHLRQFPVDALKIDRSFVAAMGKSAEGEALLRTLVQFGKMLGVTTLAEGIEDHMQFARLRREQFDGGQGFLLAKPLDASEFEARLAEPEQSGTGEGLA